MTYIPYAQRPKVNASPRTGPTPTPSVPPVSSEHATRTLAKDGYFPFGAGPHQCIGQHFAMMEAKIAFASLLRRFRVHLTNQKLPPAWAGITLRPQSTVPIRLERR